MENMSTKEESKNTIEIEFNLVKNIWYSNCLNFGFNLQKKNSKNFYKCEKLIISAPGIEPGTSSSEFSTLLQRHPAVDEWFNKKNKYRFGRID